MTNAPPWAGRKGRFFSLLDVTQTLSGPLSLPLHVLTGAADGPTVGIIGTVHGDETLPAMMMRRLFDELDPGQLCGRICVLPVANPVALAAFNRQTPEQHGKTDLHDVFPGNRRGNITQMIAATITANLICHVDVLIDYHCGGLGGRLQDRVDIHGGASEDLKARSIGLARHFGTVMMHENTLAGTAVGHANSLGKVAFNAETAGVYLAPAHTRQYVDRGTEGFRNVLKALGMLEGDPAPPPRQLLFPPECRKEVNPSRGGYLDSYFEDPDELGRPVAAGTKLGEIVDMYTLEVIEELVAPVAGYLFFSRYSGVVDAGTKAFALAEEQGSQWLE
jgi:hypothetical protein